MRIAWKKTFIESCESTNTWLVDQIKNGESPVGTVLVAKRQTEGRGRMGRPWHSPAGNLAMSLAVPVLRESKIFQYNLIAALALREVLEKNYRQSAKIKWPNDVWVGDKKLCGILSEKAPGSPIVIVGIGVNLNSCLEDFPAPLRPALTTLRDLTGAQIQIENFVENFLPVFTQKLRVYAEQDFAPLRHEMEKNMLWLGKTISVSDPSPLEGICEGLDECGFLLLRDDKNAIRRIVTGEVRGKD